MGNGGLAMTNAEKQEILNAIKAESQSVDELVEVSSLDNIKSLPALRGSELVSLEEMPFIVRDMTDHEAVEAMKDGDVILLQSTRFRGAEETKNGEGFSRELADLADDYVCDAFGSSHRAHASVAGVTKFLTE